MKHAIAELEITLSTLEHNEPIHRKEGLEEQADLCARKAAEIRQVLRILRAAEGGPIWPEPTCIEPPKFTPLERKLQAKNETLKHYLDLILQAACVPSAHQTLSSAVAEALTEIRNLRIENEKLASLVPASDPPPCPIQAMADEVAPPSPVEVDRVVRWMQDVSKHLYPSEDSLPRAEVGEAVVMLQSEPLTPPPPGATVAPVSDQA